MAVAISAPDAILVKLSPLVSRRQRAGRRTFVDQTLTTRSRQSAVDRKYGEQPQCCFAIRYRDSGPTLQVRTSFDTLAGFRADCWIPPAKR